MEITNCRTKDLIHYHQNNKVHDEVQIERIANSIKEFGFIQPIVIDSKNEIIIGHGRRLAAKLIGLTEVPVVLADNLSEMQVKKLRILDNRLNESAYDMVSLKLELEDIGDLNIGELDITIEELFPNLDDDIYSPEDEEVDEENENKKTCVKVFVNNKSDAAILVGDLESMGYTDIMM